MSDVAPGLPCHYIYVHERDTALLKLTFSMPIPRIAFTHGSLDSFPHSKVDTVTDVTLSEPGYDVHHTKSTADRTIYVDLVALYIEHKISIRRICSPMNAILCLLRSGFLLGLSIKAGGRAESRQRLPKLKLLYHHISRQKNIRKCPSANVKSAVIPRSAPRAPRL